MNLNPIDFNYIDALNIYPLQLYIDDNITQLTTTGLYSSNIFLNNNLKINDALFFSSSNLYIKNNIAFGEIRFSTFVNYPDNSNFNYGTKIDFAGRLQIYHNYNLLQPLFPAGWYDVSDELLQLKADGINTDIQLTALDASVGIIANDIVAIDGQLLQVSGTLTFIQEQLQLIQQEIDYIAGELPQRTQIMTASQTSSELIESFGEYLLRDRNRLNTTINAGVQLAVGSALIGGIASLAGYLYNEHMSNLAYNIQPSNFTLTPGDRSNLLYQTDTQTVYFASNYNVYNSNQGINNGFINSNITNTQFINSLNTNELKLNQNNISNIFISSNTLSNLNIINGFLNSNITTPQFISSLNTSNIYMVNAGNINNIGTAYINVCQANLLSTSLNTNVGFPTSNLGGFGDKIILRNGTSTTYPISCGIDSNYSLWHSLSSNNTSTAFDWYIDGTKKMSLKNNRLDVNTLIYQNGKSIETFTRETILFYTPNVSKKYGFNFSCSTAIVIGGITYYKYDIDLRLYTSTKTAININTPYRYFTIRLYFASAYFEIMVNNTYNVLSYEIAMSNEANAGTLGGQIGINILAHHIGNTPSNPLLVNILPSYFSLMRTTDFNYLSVISTVNGINLNCIIEDLLF